MGIILFRMGLFVCLFAIILGLSKLTPAGEIFMPIVGILGAVIGLTSAVIPD